MAEVDIGDSEPDNENDETLGNGQSSGAPPRKPPIPLDKDEHTTRGMANLANETADWLKDRGHIVKASDLRPYGSGYDMSKLGMGKRYGGK